MRISKRKTHRYLAEHPSTLHTGPRAYSPGATTRAACYLK